jgi:hypothetical protein
VDDRWTALYWLNTYNYSTWWNNLKVYIRNN